MAESRPGVGVDAAGGAVVDPTKNVLDLVEAAVKRIDDVADLHSRLSDEKIRRIEDRTAHLGDTMNRVEAHLAQMRASETDRWEKVRQVDQLNASQLAQQLLAAVQTLATTQAATAETLRNQVTATAAAVAGQTERVINPIIDRLAVLERSSYTGQGRQAVADPAMEQLITRVGSLVESRATTTGKGLGVAAVVAAVLGTATVVGALVALLSYLN